MTTVASKNIDRSYLWLCKFFCFAIHNKMALPDIYKSFSEWWEHTKGEVGNKIEYKIFSWIAKKKLQKTLKCLQTNICLGKVTELKGTPHFIF